MMQAFIYTASPTPLPAPVSPPAGPPAPAGAPVPDAARFDAALASTLATGAGAPRAAVAPRAASGTIAPPELAAAIDRIGARASAGRPTADGEAVLAWPAGPTAAVSDEDLVDRPEGMVVLPDVTPETPIAPVADATLAVPMSFVADADVPRDAASAESAEPAPATRVPSPLAPASAPVASAPMVTAAQTEAQVLEAIPTPAAPIAGASETARPIAVRELVPPAAPSSPAVPNPTAAGVAPGTPSPQIAGSRVVLQGAAPQIAGSSAVLQGSAPHVAPAASGSAVSVPPGAPATRSVQTSGEPVVVRPAAPPIAGTSVDTVAPALANTAARPAAPAGDAADGVAGAIEARPHARAAAHSAPSPAQPVQPNGSTPPAGAPPVVSGGVATPPVVPPVPIDAPAGTPQPIAAGPAFTKLDAIEPAPAAARPDVAPGAGASHDAPMTGDDESSHDQPRRSPEFLRFATALAQVASDPRAGTGADLNVRLHEPAVVSPSAGVAPSAPPSMSAVAPTAPAAAEATPDAETLGRLVHAMRVSARAGAWEATVRLKPEHLGEVTIALRVERNSVAAVVNAEAAGVRHWLESQEQAVRAGMAEHGLHLDRFVVQRDGQRRDPQEQEPRRRAPKPPPQTGERFEIMV